MIDGQFGVAFAAGLVAVANPCGFAMLPAYLTFFLGLEGQGTNARASLLRALAVGLSVSSGFVVTFAVITAVIRNITGDVLSYSPWASIMIGVAIAILGIYLLSGGELRINTPRLDKGGKTGSLPSMVLYGISYAVVSLGCTLPTFSAYITSTLSQSSWASAVVMFLAYAAGFTVLLTSLTVAIALARQGLLRSIRKALPYVQRISGALLVLAGLYVAYYGWYELHRLGEEDRAVERVTGWSNDIAAAISDAGAIKVGVVLAVFVIAATAAGLIRRHGGSMTPTEEAD